MYSLASHVPLSHQLLSVGCLCLFAQSCIVPSTYRQPNHSTLPNRSPFLLYPLSSPMSRLQSIGFTYNPGDTRFLLETLIPLVVFIAALSLQLRYYTSQRPSHQPIPAGSTPALRILLVECILPSNTWEPDTSPHSGRSLEETHTEPEDIVINYELTIAKVLNRTRFLLFFNHVTYTMNYIMSHNSSNTPPR